MFKTVKQEAKMNLQGHRGVLFGWQVASVALFLLFFLFLLTRVSASGTVQHLKIIFQIDRSRQIGIVIDAVAFIRTQRQDNRL